MKTIVFVMLLMYCTLSVSQSIPQDKVIHFVGGALVGSYVYLWTYKSTNNKKKAIINGIVASLVVGTIKEVVDLSPGGSGFNSKDLIVTVLGGISATITIDIFKRKKNVKKTK